MNLKAGPGRKCGLTGPDGLQNELRCVGLPRPHGQIMDYWFRVAGVKEGGHGFQPILRQPQRAAALVAQSHADAHDVTDM